VLSAQELDATLIAESLAAPIPLPDLGSTAIDVSRAKDAAVIVPLRLDPEPHVVLVLRGAQLADHAGEVGFPGGKPEPIDRDLEATALRELGEEIAVASADVRILGKLRPMPVITGRYLIHPFVGLLARGAAPRVASPEIARILELPLFPLLTGERPITAVRGQWGDGIVFAPHFAVDGATLYGASAYIFYELLARLAVKLGLTLPPPELTDRLPWGDRYRAS
jgi:8-oxo-dGTP pyrophosphatase MutT (NUDIX family)